MSTNHNPDSDLELDRHVQALRQEHTDGPPLQTVSATLALLRETHIDMTDAEPQSESGRWALFERLVYMLSHQRIAAVVMATIGMVLLYTMYMVFSTFGSSVAFGDVAAKLKAARTLTYMTSTTFPGQTDAISIKTFLSDPDHVRTEMPGGIATITDAHGSLVLDPNLHTAQRIIVNSSNGPPKPGASPLSIVQSMKNLSDGKGEPAGDKMIDGVATAAFRTKLGGTDATIWADKKTALPVRVETAMPFGPSGNASVVMDHFVIDPPLPDSMFSMEVPQGYTLSTQTIDLPKLGKLDEEVATLLGHYADATKGSFPPSLTDWYSFIKVTKPGSAMNQISIEVGGVSGMLFSLPDGYTYAGKGLKRGDPEKIIFWYRPDATSSNYRAVYGDLHTGELTSDKIPTTQKSKP